LFSIKSDESSEEVWGAYFLNYFEYEERSARIFGNSSLEWGKVEWFGESDVLMVVQTSERKLEMRVLDYSFRNFGVTADGTSPKAWILHNTDEYEHIDFAINTNNTLVAIYGTKRTENRGFVHIIKLDTLETQVEIEQVQTFEDFNHLTWYNSSHFLISASRNNNHYLINADGWGKMRY